MLDSRDEACVELMRQIRASAQLQHAWIAQAWQADKGPHPAAAMLLSELFHRGECRPSELAKHRMVDVSVISRQIAQLADAGLIERRPAPEDGRASLLSVSERGHRALADWREQYIEFARRALHEWPAEDINELSDRLRAVNDDLRDVVAPGCRTRPLATAAAPALPAETPSPGTTSAPAPEAQPRPAPALSAQQGEH
jgi:DNA-binding MarR family transcriptional regulator